MMKQIYPENYLTHDIVRNTYLDLSRHGNNQTRLDVVKSILFYGWGYPYKIDNPIACLIGRCMSKITYYKEKVGFQIRFLDHQDKGKLLDIGCANGQYMLVMKMLGWDVEGIDVDEISLGYARKFNLKVEYNNIDEIDLPQNYYDAITMSHVIEHCRYPDSLFFNISNSLKKKGTFVSISPNPDSLIHKIYGASWRGLEQLRHFVHLSAKSLKLLANKYGLRAHIWTSSRNSAFMARETISIHKYGNNKSNDRHMQSILLSLLSKSVSTIIPRLGEELIMVATKDYE